MHIINSTSIYENDSFNSSAEDTIVGCPRQRNITRPLLFVHYYALLFFGSIFNFLAFIILIQRSLRRHSTFAYLAFLSLSNGLLSLVHFSKWMLQFHFHVGLERFLITCRLHRFCSDFLTHFSLFTLICVNIDRARTVTANRPSTKYPKSQFRLVLIKEFLVASVLCAFHFHWLIKYGSEVSMDGITEVLCDFDDNQTTSLYYHLVTFIYPPFELAVFVCLPLLINIVCTIIIVRSLRVRMRTAKQFRPSKISPKDKRFQRNSHGILSCFLPKTSSQSAPHPCLCFQIQCRRHTRLRMKIGRTERSLNKFDEENESIERARSNTLTNALAHDNQPQPTTSKAATILDKKHRTRRTRDLHLSAMLIGLNILYLVLNLPFNLHQTFVKRLHTSNADPCNIMFVNVLLDVLQQTFFSTNFFLYVLTNRRFREEFYNTAVIQLLCQRRQIVASKNLSSDHQKHQKRSSSLNASTNFNRKNLSDASQTMEVHSNLNRDSIMSDLEIMETTPEQELQQTTVSIDENNRFISKLVMFKELLDD